MTQKEALEILKMGHNAFITGAAGSGKTHLLNQYIKYLRDNGAEVGVTASTGIAATHMGGMTIHAWSGIGVRDKLTEYDLEDLEGKKIGVFPGSTATNLLKKFLSDNNIDISKIEFIQIVPPNQLPALYGGSIDVLHAYEPTTAIALQRK